MTNLTSESKWLQVRILKAAALLIQDIWGWVCERGKAESIGTSDTVRCFEKQEQHTPFDLDG